MTTSHDLPPRRADAQPVAEMDTPLPRSRHTILRLLLSAAALSSALWALLPLDSADFEAPELEASHPSHVPPTLVPLDLAAFNAPLWLAPPQPPAAAVNPPPAPPPPPPPPIRWQLLAIVREETGYTALVYDPDIDKVLTLGEGDASGLQRVLRVSATSIDVQDRAGTRTLALGDAAPGSAP